MEPSVTIKRAGPQKRWLVTCDFDLGKEQRLTFTFLTERDLTLNVGALYDRCRTELTKVLKLMDDPIR